MERVVSKVFSFYISLLILFFQSLDEFVREFLRRNFCPNLRGVQFRIVISPVIVFFLADLSRFQFCSHLFACGAKGDAVNYVAVQFGLSQFEAAKKINEDFSLGILIGQPEIRRKQNSGVRKKEKVPTKEERIQFVQKKIDKWARDAANVLLRYLRWMEFWKEFYKPESMEEEWHPLFVEALQNESKISYLVDMLMFGTDEEILDFSRTEGRR